MDVALLDDRLLAAEVQRRLTRPLSATECKSYSPPSSGAWAIGSNDDCTTNKNSLQHLINAQQLARAGTIGEAQEELEKAGKYKRFAEERSIDHSKWAAALRADALIERSRREVAFQTKENFKTNLSEVAKDQIEAFHLRPDDETALELVGTGEKFAKAGFIDEAVQIYSQAKSLRNNLFQKDHFKSDSPEAQEAFRYLNNICWYGAEKAQAENVLEFCDAAVEMELKPGLARDNRAIALARAGFFDRALADANLYLDAHKDSATNKERNDWLNCIQKLPRPLLIQSVDGCTVTMIHELGGHPVSKSFE
jgi:tetratricopeptide (TPR) repeat protein